jgi:hypothetical protein
MKNSNEEKIKKFDLYLYNDANIHAEKILDSMLPMMREAIAKAYVQGFIKAMSIQKIKQDKENGNN